MSVELNTRISLRYDSFSAWTERDPELLAGEVAIASLTNVNSTTGGTAAEGGGQHPVLMKVGPGKFNSLPWVSALAADVHTWAKKSESEFTEWVKGLVTVEDIDLSNYYTKSEVDGLLTTNSSNDQKYAKDYADGLAKNYDAAGTAQGLIEGLDVTDNAVTGQYVSAVSETDGKISVTRADLPTYTLASGSANGTVAFNGADVAVTGLGSAAYTDAKAYDAAGAAETVNTALESYKTTNNAAVEVMGGDSNHVSTNTKLFAKVELDGKWGFINDKGEIVIEPQYDWAYDFKNGTAKVVLNDEEFYIDEQGEIVIEPKFYE